MFSHSDTVSLEDVTLARYLECGADTLHKITHTLWTDTEQSTDLPGRREIGAVGIALASAVRDGGVLARPAPAVATAAVFRTAQRLISACACRMSPSVAPCWRARAKAVGGAGGAAPQLLLGTEAQGVGADARRVAWPDRGTPSSCRRALGTGRRRGSVRSQTPVG